MDDPIGGEDIRCDDVGVEVDREPAKAEAETQTLGPVEGPWLEKRGDGGRGQDSADGECMRDDMMVEEVSRVLLVVGGGPSDESRVGGREDGVRSSTGVEGRDKFGVLVEEFGEFGGLLRSRQGLVDAETGLGIAHGLTIGRC